MTFWPKIRAVSTLSHLLHRILRAERPTRRDAILLMALDIATIGVSVASPYLLKSVVDSMTLHAVAIMDLAARVSLYVLSWTLSGWVSYLRLGISLRLINRLTERLALDAATGAAPRLATAEQSDSGDVQGALERLPYSLALIVDGLLGRLTPLTLQAVSAVLLMSRLVPWRYGGVLLTTLALFLIVSTLGHVRQGRLSGAAHQAASAVSSRLADVLRNARRVVVNSALSFEISALSNLYGARRQADAQMTRALLLLSAAQYLLMGSGLLALMLMAALDVASGRLSLGDFVLIQAYTLTLIAPLNGLGLVLAQAGPALVNLDAVLKWSKPANAKCADRTVSPPQGAGRLEVRDLAVTYPNGQCALRRITFSLAPRAFVVIVGASGAGKSSLAKAIAGLVPLSGGEARVEGVRVEALPSEARWRWVMYAPQTITLFDRSLLDNALYPPTNLTERNLISWLARWRFAPDAQIDLSARVGEQGARLSGGQIQKLELARLMGVESSLLVLDESTSALDTASEAKVLAALASRKRASTLIMVTHRRAIAEMADQVVFLEAGELTAIGAHSALWARLSSYRALWGEP
ncbi:MAG TPA: ABC transporter ATP-binding protein [Asticcacaulis sp.]|nr:ABC transporter ATP-binding protein [Asticcacaulis sp.]